MVGFTEKGLHSLFELSKRCHAVRRLLLMKIGTVTTKYSLTDIGPLRRASLSDNVNLSPT